MKGKHVVVKHEHEHTAVSIHAFPRTRRFILVIVIEGEPLRTFVPNILAEVPLLLSVEETKRHHSFSVVGHSQRWGARNGANQCAPTSLGRRSGRPGGRSAFATRISCSRCRRIGSRRPPGSSPLALHRPRASRLALLSRASRAARLARLPARSQTWVARRRLGLPPRRPHRADHAHAHARAAATATRAIGRRAYLTHCPSIDRPTDGIGPTD